jgi:simple sugar transport system permease protein
VRIEIVHRQKLPPAADALIVALAVAAAALAGGVVMAAAGLPPLAAYRAIFRAAFFGGAYALSDTAVKTAPLILCGVGCALAFRAGLWNVGAEGQLLLGAWAATGVASFWTPADLSPWLKLPLMMLAGGALGGLWGLIPGALKVRFGVSEILTSLMLVYVAAQWNLYWIYSPWTDRGFQLTPLFPPGAHLPRLADFAGVWPQLAGLTIHAGLPLALVVAAALAVLMQRSRWGMAWTAMGDNPRAAAAAGINVAFHTMLAMALSGVAAGLAGAVEAAGVAHRLQERFSPGFGFTAIAVAWLARLNPWATVALAFVFGGILVGGKEVGSLGVALLLQGALLLTVIAFEAFRRYRVVIRRAAPAPEAQP